MIVAIYCLSVCLCLSVSMNYALWRYWRTTTNDLLNRLMAKDLGEYKVAEGQIRPRRVPMTDEIEAMIERQRKEAASAR